MKRPLPFAVLFTIALTFVSLLPLYIERTMTHVMFAHGGGGTIEWGWKRCTLRTFFSDYRYFRHNPHPELWIAMNVILALIYALIIAYFVSRILATRANSQSAGSVSK
jgi:hypothetical protein